MVTHLTDDNIQKFISENKTAVIKFSASWCGPCRVLAPMFEKLSDEHSSKLSFGSYSFDDSSKFGEELGIQNLPVVILFTDGKETERITGFNQVAIKELISRLTSN